MEYLGAKMQREIEALQNENVQLKLGISAVRELIDESLGVAGLHKNGEIAKWSDLQERGYFESWLIEFNKAEDLLSK